VNGKFVGYFRVSTKKQGMSGLGLGAQREAVLAHCTRSQGALVREFVEVESGANDERPKLTEALAFARRSKATLIVAKLDRLSRNQRFIATVLDSGVDFAAADMPEANRLTLDIMAAIAAWERRAIADRTRAAMRIAKANGQVFGSHDARIPRLSKTARRKGSALGSQANREKAREEYQDLIPYVTDLRSEGHSLRVIAQRLNDDGHLTRNDRPWSATQVMRVLALAAA
jgi:DNA invertase Pin-like site-specific DNA recombinase